jgi:hypothetical protein
LATAKAAVEPVPSPSTIPLCTYSTACTSKEKKKSQSGRNYNLEPMWDQAHTYKEALKNKANLQLEEGS